MPIALQTAYNPGDLDPGKTYDHVELSAFGVEIFARSIYFEFCHGYIDAQGSFAKGLKEPVRFYVQDKPRAGTTDYTDMMAEISQDGEIISSAVARVLYTYVLVNGIFVGTPADPNA